MKKLFAFIRLLRPINLLIVIATAYALRWWILKPLVATAPIPMELTMSEFDFFILTFMLVLLTGAGNIINDYFDLRVDRINKPNRIIIDKYIKRRVAMAAHVSMNAISVILGIYLSWKAENVMLVAIPLFVAGSLWYYSTSFKKQFLIGNIVVAIMAALLPLLVGLFELPKLFASYYDDFARFCEENETINGPWQFFQLLWIWIFCYAAYAFIVTVVREIQKDMEDIEGDRAAGYETLPIEWGIKAGVWSSVGILLVIILSLVYLQTILFDPSAWLAKVIFNGLLVLPLVLSMFFTLKGRKKQNFSMAAFFTKLAMFGMLVMTWYFSILIAA